MESVIMTDVTEAVPATFEAARAHLQPRLVGSVAHAITLLELSNAGQESGAIATIPVADDLNVGAVVMTGIGGVQVSAGILASWGVDAQAVVDAAIENTFGQEFSNVRQLGEATYVIEDETFAAAAVARPAMLASLPVSGALVAIAPSTGVLVVTGASDEQGLAVAATVADAAVEAGEKLVSATAVTLVGDAWVTFAWPAAGAAASVAGLLARRWSTVLYAWQAPALTIYLAAIGKPAFVAAANLAKAPNGDTITYATLSEGVVTALPVTDDVVLLPDGGAPVKTTLADLTRVLGTSLENAGVAPSRVIVGQFPDAAQRSALGG
jgi:hypothetical protein